MNPNKSNDGGPSAYLAVAVTVALGMVPGLVVVPAPQLALTMATAIVVAVVATSELKADAARQGGVRP